MSTENKTFNPYEQRQLVDRASAHAKLVEDLFPGMSKTLAVERKKLNLKPVEVPEPRVDAPTTRRGIVLLPGEKAHTSIVGDKDAVDKAFRKLLNP